MAFDATPRLISALPLTIKILLNEAVDALKSSFNDDCFVSRNKRYAL